MIEPSNRIEAGKLRHRVTIRRRSAERPEEFEDLQTVWAQVDELTGGESAARILGRVDTRFRMRFRDDVTTAERIVHAGVEYDVQGIMPVGRRVGIDVFGLRRVEGQAVAAGRPAKAVNRSDKQPMKPPEVIVVAGAPASGKTTYVREHAKPGELILDVDDLFKALSGWDRNARPEALLPFVLAARDAVVARLARPGPLRRGWVITATPDPAKRDALVRRTGGRLVVLATPAAVCEQRLRSRKAQRKNLKLLMSVVKDWWRQYDAEKTTAGGEDPGAPTFECG